MGCVKGPNPSNGWVPTKEAELQVVNDYSQTDKLVETIMDEHGILSRKTIYNILDRYGVKRRVDHRRDKWAKKRSPATEEHKP